MENIKKMFSLVRSSTAKDTYTLFFGNTLSAFLGFLFTLIVARNLSLSDFGIFSAATNLVVILTSLTDLGISTGAVNFVSSSLSKGKVKLANKYIMAATVTRFSVTFVISLLVIMFAPFVSTNLLAGGDSSAAIWVGLVSLSLGLPMLLPFFLQAKKKFVASIVADNVLYLVRLLFTFGFVLMSVLTIGNSLLAFVIGGVLGTTTGILLIGPGFLKTRPSISIYKKLFRFSGWIGVNRVISSISGRLDIQMLAIFASATATGLYSIPSRLAGFVVVLASSFSGVLAPRMAGFNDREKEKRYIVKALLALIPISLGLILWIIIAEPFITILFGDKFIDSVPIFQSLVAAMIPFIFTAPSVTAIIYSMKKTVYIGVYSFFQIIAIFTLNYIFIPKYGPIGPAITFAITNTLLLIYTWTIVIRHYWKRT
ncbi:oligosaccharide flippase family protein [Candidatus Microgenomates bacterium]|nr:oligosaccharide flippase family protein [Candidatus Microgenomates bacterium]